MFLRSRHHMLEPMPISGPGVHAALGRWIAPLPGAPLQAAPRLRHDSEGKARAVLRANPRIYPKRPYFPQILEIALKV